MREVKLASDAAACFEVGQQTLFDRQKELADQAVLLLFELNGVVEEYLAMRECLY